MFDLGITTCNISDACPLWARYRHPLNSFSDSSYCTCTPRCPAYCRPLSVEPVQQPVRWLTWPMFSGVPRLGRSLASDFHVDYGIMTYSTLVLREEKAKMTAQQSMYVLFCNSRTCFTFSLSLVELLVISHQLFLGALSLSRSLASTHGQPDSYTLHIGNVPRQETFMDT